MAKLFLTNSQAPIHAAFVRELAEYLGARTPTTIEIVTTGMWAEREARFEAGEIALGWICGAPYVEKMARHLPLRLLAAPVMAHPRYKNRPIYFSDVIVRAESEFLTFDDLRGARWVYNEPNSHSGYHTVRHYLAVHDLTREFFGDVRASGAHETSVLMILRDEADASAIDSSVLEMLFAATPALREQLRVIESIGPSPMPPLVTSVRMSLGMFIQLETALTAMHNNPDGLAILQRAQMARFVKVSDADYNAIREMLARASAIEL